MMIKTDLERILDEKGIALKEFEEERESLG